MRSRFLALCLAKAIPTLALLGSVQAFFLVRGFLEGQQSQELSRYNASAWTGILVCAWAGLICLAIALWWAIGLIYYYLAVKRTRAGARDVKMPVWVPQLLKTLAGASLGLGVLAPTQAYASAANEHGSSTSVNLTTQSASPLFLHSLSPEFREGQISSVPPDSSSTAVSPLFLSPHVGGQTTTSVLPIQAVTYHSVSPLFGGKNRSVSDAPQQTEKSHITKLDSSQAEKNNGSAQEPPRSYQVLPGDSLWSIAENKLPAQATGAEVLALVHTIWQLNQDTIPTLDTLIFPGQVINLPS